MEDRGSRIEGPGPIAERRGSCWERGLSPQPVPASQRYQRVARALNRPGLTPAWLTAGLVRGAVALLTLPPVPGALAGRCHLVLDSLRCGRWEVFPLGLVWHGRVVPVGWVVLP